MVRRCIEPVMGLVRMAVFASVMTAASLVHAQASLRPMSPPEIAGRVNWQPQCSNYAILGYCYCNGVPCAWHVAHYLPVSFIETVRRPGETLVVGLDFSQMSLAAGAGLAGHTRQINQEGMDNTFEARNYSLPEQYLQWETGCMTCKSSYAKVPYSDTSNGLVGNWGSGACGTLSNVLNKLTSFQRDSGSGQGTSMSLYYASEADALHWRTGCRDVSLTNLLRSNAFTCGANGLAEFAGAAEPMAQLLGRDACIGNWSPHYPRQMRTRGPTQVIAAAVAAYRSISIARTDTQTFPFPVDTAGKFQLAYPKISQCVRPGKLPLPTDMRPSPDGAFGWIYWRPVSCCIPFEVVENCFS